LYYAPGVLSGCKYRLFQSWQDRRRKCDDYVELDIKESKAAIIRLIGYKLLKHSPLCPRWSNYLGAVFSIGLDFLIDILPSYEGLLKTIENIKSIKDFFPNKDKSKNEKK